MSPPIVVINPNRTERITDQIREAVALVESPLLIDVVTSSDGPVAIESDRDIEASIDPMLATAAATPAGAYVVACFSDPGLDRLRAESGVPVFGIAESALHAAANVSRRVGIVSTSRDSAGRHNRYWQRLGMSGHVSGDVPVGLGVLDFTTEDAYQRVRGAARALVEAGAGVVVLGCTGMAHLATRLQIEEELRVIDPCGAAVADAINAIAGSRVFP